MLLKEFGKAEMIHIIIIVSMVDSYYIYVSHLAN